MISPLMKKKIIFLISFLLAISLTMFIFYWLNTQPVAIVTDQPEISADIPEKNTRVIAFTEANGRTLAPDYDAVVCTEFVISILESFTELSAQEKRDIRIISNDDLKYLVDNDAEIIRGVQHALTRNQKGIPITNNSEVKPGDFVQFRNVYNGKTYGHCGIVMEVDPNNTLTVYSSHPLTNGYGKQKFLWPDKVFFVRLNQ